MFNPLLSVHIQPLGFFERLFGKLMVPIMYLLSGTFLESPQQTHPKNNTKLFGDVMWRLKYDCMVACDRDEDAKKRYWYGIPRFHMPIFGGWRKYVVIRPQKDEEWHVGWSAGDVCGISRIKLTGPVRLLRGDSPVLFFGVSVATGEQIHLAKVADGVIGDNGLYSRDPLL